MQRILTIICARPQFMKASVVSRAIQFNQLNIPRQHIQLDIHGGSHGVMTGRMLAKIEQSLLEYKPDRDLVYGDTNTNTNTNTNPTLAGALAAVKLHIPVAHVEAGLRS